MGQTVRFQETLRRLAMIDEASSRTRPGSGIAAAAPEVATALGYDVAAAPEEPGGY
jgi:hypothetical protein